MNTELLKYAVKTPPIIAKEVVTMLILILKNVCFLELIFAFKAVIEQLIETQKKRLEEVDKKRRELRIRTKMLILKDRELV